MKIIVHGATGKVGKALLAIIQESHDLTLYQALRCPQDGSFEMADVVIDFSNASCIKALLEKCEAAKCPLVCGTTALSTQDFANLEKLSTLVPVVYSTNFSIGISLLNNFLKDSMPHLLDAEIDILETHDTTKKDAPSGTSLSLTSYFKSKHIHKGYKAFRTKEDLVITSLRKQGSFGAHELIISFDDEELCITHKAKKRTCYAKGALLSARYIANKPAGLYTFDEVIKNTRELLQTCATK